MSRYDTLVLAEQILPFATINRTSAETIRSSIHHTGDIWTRLDSQYVVFPKMVMGERNRHRCYSLSDRSSRAVPPEKLIGEIRSGIGLAMPAKFRKRAKGMGGGEDLIGAELIEAQLDWIADGLEACDAAERALARDEEKETVNRRLDMFIYMHSLQTATRAGWLNFLGLRLANASPTIEVLAARCYETYKATTPEPLRPGEWHLPFTDSVDEGFIDISAAHSAHLSYNDLATGQLMTIPRALDIATKLRDSAPLHASPFEHQATPDRMGTAGSWARPFAHGNLPGWIQARKQIRGEAIAALPEGWSL